MTHEVVLHGYNVKPGSLQLGTFDSYGIEKIHVTADDEWAGLDILAVFHAPDGTATKVVAGADGMLAVPPEATAKQAGVGRIVFVGLTENVQRITVDMGYNIKPHSDIEGDNPGTPTPDVVQQILENSNHAVSIATAAQEAAENARQAAEDAAQKAGEGAGGAAQSAAAAKKSAEEAAASSESAAGKAEESASSASAAAKNAKAAQTAQGSAENAAQTAADAAGAARQAAGVAGSAAKASSTSAGEAAQSAEAAETAKQRAEDAAKKAIEAKTGSENALQDADAAKDAASGYADAAAKSVTAAAASEKNAAKSANSAADSAAAAKKSADDADNTANSIKDSMAQIAANKEAVSQLKEDLGELEIGTKNIFNSRELLNATGWTRNGNSYTGTAGNLGKAYKENNYPISFEPNTKYTISLKALTNGSASTDGIGIQFEFYYTDGTKSTLELLNNTLTETSYVFGTNSQKSISYMRIRHSSGGNNTWVLSEIQIEKGNKTNYVNPFTANDIIAKEKIEKLESKTNVFKENTEIKINEVNSDIDNLAVQSNNLIIAVGIDNVKNKGFYVSTDDGYNAFPFIGTVKDKLVCVYSVGKNHTDNTSVDIFAKTSPNGVIWSKAKKIISTENVRDTITGLGHDSLGIIYFWNRKGTPVNADCSFDLYKTGDGIVFTKKSSPVFDIKPSHIGDALHIPTVGVISFYNTYRANRNSYGYVLTKDGGETWSQIEIASPTTQSDTPTEIYGVYIGDGKIIALGRSEDSAAMFQIQSNDYGKTWETKKTNITDVYLSTPTLIYGDDGYITVYYYNRADGKLKERRAIASTVFENPSSWGEPSNIASGAVGQDAGNANSVKFNGNNIIAYYSGTDTETSVIDVIN